MNRPGRKKHENHGGKEGATRYTAPGNTYPSGNLCLRHFYGFCTLEFTWNGDTRVFYDVSLAAGTEYARGSQK